MRLSEDWNGKFVMTIFKNDVLCKKSFVSYFFEAALKVYRICRASEAEHFISHQLGP